MNRLDASRQDVDELFGSGSFSWFPQSSMELNLSYGDQQLEGARGILLRTRIDLDGM